MSRSVYVYTDAHRREHHLFKVGDTERTVAERVEEQDSTSQPVPLETIAQFQVPDHIRDYAVHAWLEKNGFAKFRTDKSRPASR